MITNRWVQKCCQRFQIVQRALSGKIKISPAKDCFIEREVVFDLPKLHDQFLADILDEENIENADETHFIIDMDSGKALGFKGSDEVK